jgi:hypothetical protein
MEEMYDIAYDIQNRWKQGSVAHFNVVETFLDDLLFGNRSNSSVLLDEDLLSRLNIITTVKGSWFGLNAVVRKPESLEHLHEMLLQTTWIPYATGGDLWLKDHMDGAFTVSQHPKCEHSVGISSDLDLLANIVNVNVTVEKFYALAPSVSNISLRVITLHVEPNKIKPTKFKGFMVPCPRPH